ncbi:MAG TPA: glycosyltransferase [Thermoanaerobaculia bacterium]|nr:glycosyltransferase [Thermoanaerobaculia bacterium]
MLSTAGTHGDYLAFAGLGRALVARGHDVVVAVNAAAHALFRDAGLAVVACGRPYGEEEARSHVQLFDEWNPLPKSERSRILREIFDREENDRDLAAACEGADLLVAISLQPAARRVHEELKIPWVAVSLLPADFARGKPTYARATRTLLASSRHYSEPKTNFSSLRMTGFWFPDRFHAAPPLEVESFLAAGDPPVVLSFGSLPVRNAREVVAIHARAARQIGLRLLVQRGWANLDLEEEGVLVTGALSHDWLFPRSAAVIHHAGAGVTARAIRHACPMVVEPYGRDQFFNAWRTTHLGIGVTMHPHRLTVDGLSRALDRAMSAPFTTRLAALSELIRAEDGYGIACDEIDDLIHQKYPERSDHV